MTGLMALSAAVGIVLAASTLTVATLYRPLRRELAARCTLDTTAAFWMRSMVALLYLLPLFAVLVFGLPKLTYEEYTTAEVLRRALATTVSTLALFVIAIGLRLSMAEPPGKFDYPPPVR
jgi:hypothetical protein